MTYTGICLGYRREEEIQGCPWDVNGEEGESPRVQFISFPLFPSLELISILISFFLFFSITFISLVCTQESNKFKFKFKKKKKKERKKERKREKKKKRKEKDEVITACGRPRSREHPRGWPSSQRKGLGAEGQPRARRPAKLQKKKKRV